MDVDPTQFDSVIEAVNEAMHRIEEMLAHNGLKLDPAWIDVPTLSSLGIGKGKGGKGGGGGGKGGGGGGDKEKKKKVEGYK